MSKESFGSEASKELFAAMVRRADTRSKNAKVPKVEDVAVLYADARIKELENYVVLLWTLLDNIDTAGDSYKPEMTPYFRYVESMHQGRFHVADTDGHQVFIKPDMPPADSRKPKQGQKD